MAEAFTAGVKMGGLTNDTEIRILLCYLIKSVGPVTREAMEAALLQEELVNYFEFVGALNDLVAQGLAIEGANGYTITDKGTTVAQTLSEDLPRSVRESAILAVIRIQSWVHKSINYNVHDMKRQFAVICASYASVPVTRVPKVKVGVVGEIYVKYSPLGNNDLEKFLESQDCEVNLPGLMGFVEYCVANMTLDVELYGGSKVKAMATDKLLDWMDSIGCAMNDAMRKSGFYAPGSFRELMEKPKGIISLGAKMGEGWLLTAEMIELVEGGYENIVCAQPFGCLPNHIVGKGMINQIRARYPQANITPVDYDPSATRVNQENRIKLMLAVAKERLNAPAEAKPLTAEEIAGGAPKVGATV